MVMSSGGQQVVITGAGGQQMVVMQGGQPTASVGATTSDGPVTSDAALAQLTAEAGLLEGESGAELGEGVTLQLEGGVMEHGGVPVIQAVAEQPQQLRSSMPVALGGWNGNIEVIKRKTTIYLMEVKEFKFCAKEAGTGPLTAVMEGAEIFIRKEEGEVWVVGIKGIKKGFGLLKIGWGGVAVTQIKVKCVDQEQSLMVRWEVVGKLIGMMKIVCQ